MGKMRGVLGLALLLVACGGGSGGAELEPDSEVGDDRGESWVFMQSHLHTTGYHSCANDPMTAIPLPDGACFTSQGISDFLQEALDNNATDMIITDHNNIDAWFDPAFAPMADGTMARYATPLRGSEWSSKNGHMTLLFPTEAATSNAQALAMGWIFEEGNDADVMSDDDYITVINSVHSAGGVVMINHPELLIHAYPEATLGADGIEVGIPPNPLDDVTFQDPIPNLQASKEARDFWQRRLVSGDRVAGTAGADHHSGDGDIPGLEAATFGTAVNLVRVDPDLPNTVDAVTALAEPTRTIDQRSAIIIDAVRRGHIMIVESQDAARVYLGADIDGDGRFHDARAGDCILPDRMTKTEMRLRFRITNVTSTTLTTHYNFVVWTAASVDSEILNVEVDYDDGFAPDPAYDIDPNDPFTIEMTVPYDANAKNFLRVVLERDVLGPFNDTDVVTNPIYFGNWGSECDGSAPLY